MIERVRESKTTTKRQRQREEMSKQTNRGRVKRQTHRDRQRQREETDTQRHPDRQTGDKEETDTQRQTDGGQSRDRHTEPDRRTDGGREKRQTKREKPTVPIDTSFPTAEEASLADHPSRLTSVCPHPSLSLTLGVTGAFRSCLGQRAGLAGCPPLVTAAHKSQEVSACLIFRHSTTTAHRARGLID